MRTMSKLFGLAAVASAVTIAGAGAANAEVTANVALTTDYVFRGISLSDGAAIQGGFDVSEDLWYAGVWASNVVEGMELDLYAGFTPTTGPVEWDLGLIGYFYPGADDDGAEFDYVELMAAGSFTITEQFSAGGAVFWAPENFGDTGEAIYLEINGEFTVNDQLAFSAAFGNQSIEDPDGGPGGAEEDDYNTWNIGGAYALHGFELDLRYHDTDIDAGSDIENYTYGPDSYDSTVVFTVKREL
jgi:uncharacterized protein (TIGR02001 family)